MCFLYEHFLFQYEFPNILSDSVLRSPIVSTSTPASYCKKEDCIQKTAEVQLIHIIKSYLMVTPYNILLYKVLIRAQVYTQGPQEWKSKCS